MPCHIEACCSEEEKNEDDLGGQEPLEEQMLEALEEAFEEESEASGSAAEESEASGEIKSHAAGSPALPGKAEAEADTATAAAVALEAEKPGAQIQTFQQMIALAKGTGQIHVARDLENRQAAPLKRAKQINPEKRSALRTAALERKADLKARAAQHVTLLAVRACLAVPFLCFLP